MSHDTIAIVDNGGQFTHLISTKVRNALKVKTVIVSPSSDVSELRGVKGIILSGGPDSIHEEGSVRINPGIMDLDVPILGLCYGLHQLAIHYGGDVEGSSFKEYGFAALHLEDDPIFKGVPQDDRVWMSHGDKVLDVPDGFARIGATENCPVAAMSDVKRRRWGFQFHPEVSDTIHGSEMLENFVVGICGARQDWTVESNIDEIVKRIRKEAGERKVLALLSGGVDSTVVAALLNKALPSSQTRYIHIDTGLMRKDESASVAEALGRIGIVDLEVVDASHMYLSSLEGVQDPEEKRVIIGRLFVEIVNEIASEAKEEDWVLAQGTLYPDTIESGGTENAAVIKTHHNRVDLIMEMIRKGQVIEPVKDLYKAEVREVGEQLGLPWDLVHRQPFPGPGLGIRALCQDGWLIHTTMEGVHEIQGRVETGIEEDAWAKGKVKGLVLPVRSVGVKGDARSYKHPVALGADGKVDWPAIKLFSTRLVNKVAGINRCVLMMGLKDVSTPAPVERFITEERMDLLRECDDIVMEGLKEHELYDSVWQCPTVLVPISFSDGEMVVIRPVWSQRAMTAEVSELPDEFYDDIIPRLLSLPGIDSVAVDVTSKPPGTIEWE